MIQTMNKVISYADASVLISAGAKATSQNFARKMRALRIINDDERVFVGSEFLKLEVLPISRFFGKSRETKFYENFFSGVIQWASSDDLIAPALDLASEFGLGALDAIHLCAARHFGAEFISAEKPTKPIYRAYSNISSIYED
jgi:predicted nucleic acid-binding protein